jgi:hypothetical protein
MESAGRLMARTASHGTAMLSKIVATTFSGVFSSASVS